MFKKETLQVCNVIRMHKGQAIQLIVRKKQYSSACHSQDDNFIVQAIK